jgi:hypothetical protein
VRSIGLRHDRATFKGRLRALEAKMAQEHLILTGSRLAAPERKGSPRRDRDWASGVFGGAGHVVRGEYQGWGAYLPADVHRPLCQSGVLQAV